MTDPPFDVTVGRSNSELTLQLVVLVVLGGMPPVDKCESGEKSICSLIQTSTFPQKNKRLQWFSSHINVKSVSCPK